MKKLITVLVLLACCLAIGGCSKDNQKTTWEMQSIQNKDGNVVYCNSKNKDLYVDATIKDISAVLEDSFITITDKTTGDKWIGECKLLDSSQSDTVIYEVVFDDNTTGHIGKSITKYDDNAKANTLIVSCNRYSLNFFESASKSN